MSGTIRGEILAEYASKEPAMLRKTGGTCLTMRSVDWGTRARVIHGMDGKIDILVERAVLVSGKYVAKKMGELHVPPMVEKGAVKPLLAEQLTQYAQYKTGARDTPPDMPWECIQNKTGKVPKSKKASKKPVGDDEQVLDAGTGDGMVACMPDNAKAKLAKLANLPADKLKKLLDAIE
jgi:hypothetical protein